MQPLCGQLTEIYGHRAGLVVAGIIFAVGNLCCGLAESPSIMILGRVLAGIGGGGMNAIGSFVCNDLFSLRERGLWQGLGNLLFGLGHGLGGLLGGLLNDLLGWRSPFLVITLLAIWFIIASIRLVQLPAKNVLSAKARLSRINFLGSISLALLLVLFLFGLNSACSAVPWTHPLVIIFVSLSIGFFGIFLYIEIYVAEEPVIPVRLMLNRNVAGPFLANSFDSMASSAILFYMPIYFRLQGLSTTAAGARVLPQSFGNVVGSLVAGFMIYYTNRLWHLSMGFLLVFAIASGTICTLNLDTASWLPLIYLVLVGLGFGGMVTTMLVALLSAVPPEFQAVLTATNYAFRSVGSTIGIADASAIFDAVLTTQLWRRFGDEADADDFISSIKNSIDKLQHLAPTLIQPALESYMTAFRFASFSFLGFAILGLFSGSMFVEPNFKSQSPSLAVEA